MSMDKMTLRGMRFFGYHGVFPEENNWASNLSSIWSCSWIFGGGRDRRSEATVNYAEVHAFVKTIVEGPPFKLIEALAGNIASAVLDAYTSVNEVTVSRNEAESAVRHSF